jgi:twitching motility protein PilT
VAVFEVMINTSSIGALLRDNKSFRIHNEILTGGKYGMVALESSLVDLFHHGVITRDQVIAFAQDPEVARQLLGERVAI